MTRMGRLVDGVPAGTWRVLSLPIFFKVLGIGALVALIFGSTTLYLIDNSASVVHLQLLERKTLDTARSLASVLQRPMVTGDLFTVEETLDRTRRTGRDVRYIIVRDQHGQIVAHTFDRAVPNDLEQTPSSKPEGEGKVWVLGSERGRIFDIRVPILEGRAGSVQLGLTDQMLVLQNRVLTRLTLGALVFSGAVGISLAFLLTHFLTRPIRHLEEVAKRIRDGDFSARSKVFSADEIGSLAATVNHMVEGLEDYRGEVQEKEDELRESRALLQSALDGIPESIMVIDMEYNIVLANHAIQELAGKADLSGNGLKCYQAKHNGVAPCDGDGHRCPLPRVRKSKGVETETHVNAETDGNGHYAEVVAAPLLDESGEVVQVIESSRDITERVRALEEERLRQEQLVQIDKMVSLGILVSGVAHEINNPNQFIMTNASLLSDTWEGAQPIFEKYYQDNGDFLLGDLNYTELRDQMPKVLSEMFRGCQRIKFIVDELRDFSRESSADLTELVDINAVVRSSVTLLTRMIEKSTDRFSVEHGRNLPKIAGSFRRIEQVVINLIQNSCQALPGKDCAVAVSTSYDAEDDTVVLMVRDEGTGIPESAISHVTDPFYTTRRASGGTGLGLSISSSIVNEHGGVLKIQSTPEKGTTATAAFPVAEEPAFKGPNSRND